MGVRTDGNMNMRKYTKEFKQQAVDLAGSLGSISKAARELGIAEANIYNWKAALSAGSNGLLQPAILQESQAEELKRLRVETAQLRKVNQILKAAAAFFSQDSLK